MSAEKVPPVGASEAVDPDDVRATIRLLERMVEDRSLLVGLSEEDRKALLIAAGRVSRPTNHQQKRMLRAFRRSKREKAESEDKVVRAATEIRAARQTAVYVPPSRRLHGADGAPT